MGHSYDTLNMELYKKTNRFFIALPKILGKKVEFFEFKRKLLSTKTYNSMMLSRPIAQDATRNSVRAIFHFFHCFLQLN